MIDQTAFCEDQCDDAQLQQMLRSDSDSCDSAAMLDHVEQCERCQNKLDEFAADESALRKTVDVLSRHDQSASDVQLTRVRFRPEAWTDSMARQLLSPAPHPEMLGRIGRYDVERLIGSGGMGVVFKAYDTELNRPVAVKLLAPYLAGSGSARNRFAREARAAAAVVDEHVVAIHNVESDGEHPFLVMKYIAGGSLQTRLDHEGPLEVCEVLRIGMQTAKGLAAAHAQGLIHRDVKPSNILLDEGVERALLTDFGLARATDDASLTRSGFHPGTPHYMSPEQVRGEAIDGRSDLFGLGCVLYSLCTGHPPFRSETSYAVLRRITDDTPRSIRETNPNIPPWLEQVVMKLLAKSPDDRFESAEQVAELLEGCLAHVQQPTTAPLPKHVEQLSPRPATPQSDGAGAGGKHLQRLLVTGFAAFMALAGVLIFLEMRKGTIRIETNSEVDVPIVIRQGDKEVEHLIVSQKGATTRLHAGNYIIEVDGEGSVFKIEGDQVQLEHGGQWVARIRVAADDSLKKHTKTDEPTKDANNKEASRLIAEIEMFDRLEDHGPQFPRSAKWGAKLQELVELGPAAVPTISQTLDRTEHDRTIASLAFVLRAIGDKRAVPALIRTIPRLRHHKSYVNWIPTGAIDESLSAFFQQHKVKGTGDAAGAGCSSSSTELKWALSALTKQSFPIERMFGVGVPRQLYLQQKCLYRSATQWQTWWDRNSDQMVDDPTFARVNLPPMNENAPSKVEPDQLLKKIPWGWGNMLAPLQVVAMDEKDTRRSFLDLDTGRSATVPNQWRGKRLSEKAHAELLDWATTEGFDLACDVYKDERGKSHFALRHLGMRAWQIDEAKWKMSTYYTPWVQLASEAIDHEVREQWLIPESEDSGELDAKGMAPFLFLTSEGSPGLVYVGAEVTEPTVDDGYQITGLREPTSNAVGRKLSVNLFTKVTLLDDGKAASATTQGDAEKPLATSDRSPVEPPDDIALPLQ